MCQLSNYFFLNAFCLMNRAFAKLHLEAVLLKIHFFAILQK